MTVVRVHRRDTLQRPDAHQFIAGYGYFRHDKPPLAVPGKHPHDRCSPMLATPDGTIHLLMPPGGKTPIEFRWMKARRVWVVLGGAVMKAKRLGFTDAYLSRAGWTYLGAKV